MTFRSVLLAAALLSLGACASAPAPGSCAAAPASVGPDAMPSGYVAPRATAVFLPPTPVPDALRGQVATVVLWVDRTGRVVPDSTRVTGIADATYAGQLQARAGTFRYAPGTVAGCAVAAPTEIRFAL